MSMNIVNSLPFFSIIIPVYNRAHSIKDTLDSVLNQTFQNFECLIIDDGSKDSKLLEKIINSLNDTRFKYIWRENGGGGAARNTGIMAAKGDFIAFLDSDDLFILKKLEIVAKSIQKLEKEGMDIQETVIYSYTYVDRGVEKFWIRPDRAIQNNESVGEYLFTYNQFIQTSTIVLSTKLAQACQFDPKLKKGQDLDFCVQLGYKGANFYLIEKPLSVWVDKSEAGRTSRFKGYEAPSEWLENNKSKLSKKAYFGYRANVLSYYYSGHQPLRIIKYLAQGLVRGGVPIRVVIRQFLRCFLPKNIYRQLVNQFIRFNAKLSKQAPS